MTMENEYNGLGAFSMNISIVLFKLIFDLPYSSLFSKKYDKTSVSLIDVSRALRSSLPNLC